MDAKRVAFAASPATPGTPKTNQSKTALPAGRGSNVATSFQASQCVGYGEVIQWGNYFPVDALAAGWLTLNPSIPFRREFLGALLCNAKQMDSFLSRVPLTATARELEALTTWWQADSKAAYGMGRPQDFRRAAGK